MAARRPAPGCGSWFPPAAASDGAGHDGLSFAAIAGIMVFISLDELLPTAEETGEHHYAIYGLIAGMAIMALSLLMFL